MISCNGLGFLFQITFQWTAISLAMVCEFLHWLVVSLALAYASLPVGSFEMTCDFSCNGLIVVPFAIAIDFS